MSDEEIRIADRIANYFNNNPGEENILKAKKDIERMFEIRGGARVRKIINYLRRTGKVSNLIATSKGYYTTDDREQINRYKQSLRDRIGAIKEVLDSFE